MNDVEILKAFYTYVTEHITYDYDKADSVEAGYLPDVDETLQSGTGICFDYAALTAAMLRSQDIPANLRLAIPATSSVPGSMSTSRTKAG